MLKIVNVLISVIYLVVVSTAFGLLIWLKIGVNFMHKACI